MFNTLFYYSTARAYSQYHHDNEKSLFFDVMNIKSDIKTIKNVYTENEAECSTDEGKKVYRTTEIYGSASVLISRFHKYIM